MRSRHQIYFSDSRHMEDVPDESIDLIVTSPPYPVIEMWDPVFIKQDPKIGTAFQNRKFGEAFEGMHQQLDGVWKESFRVLKKGGLACINVGDATRTLNDDFALYSNHSRILACLQKLGFTALPCILWRKQTNAPNKFMGSGMLPPGAYVTLEHEYILIARKGSIREFKNAVEKKHRRESAFFWEERNVWFSDIWTDLKGASQDLFDKNTRKRSGAFPFELPYRLISMFSVKGDTVLDPFLGIGTTLMAAMAAARNSIGYEFDHHFQKAIRSGIAGIEDLANRRILERLRNHIRFVENRLEEGKSLKHQNVYYSFPVMTRQETELILNEVVFVEKSTGNRFEVEYTDKPIGDNEDAAAWEKPGMEGKTLSLSRSKSNRSRTPKQRSLF